jgi:3-oxoacyl-[acyl-carrier protein] reductase
LIESGRIIQITSGQSLGPMPGEISYVSTKGAIDAMTPSLAAELGHKGITVNAVDPGPTDSGWMNETLRQEFTTRFSLGRLGVPNDAAKLIAFLASDDSEWITGQIIHSNGGFA